MKSCLCRRRCRLRLQSVIPYPRSHSHSVCLLERSTAQSGKDATALQQTGQVGHKLHYRFSVRLWLLADHDQSKEGIGADEEVGGIRYGVVVGGGGV